MILPSNLILPIYECVHVCVYAHLLLYILKLCMTKFHIHPNLMHMQINYFKDYQSSCACVCACVYTWDWINANLKYTWKYIFKAFFLKCSCIKTSKTKKGRVLTIQINLKLPAIHPFGCNSREESSHCTHMPATTQSNSSYGVHPHATKSTKETKFTFHKVSIQRM